MRLVATFPLLTASVSLGRQMGRWDRGSESSNPLRESPVRQHPPNAAVASLGFSLRGLSRPTSHSRILSPR